MEIQVTLDPRSKNLGGRLIANLEKLNLSLKKSWFKIRRSKILYA